jgi:hypothetical protein
VVIGFTKRFFARNFIIPILCAFLIAGLSSVLQTVPTVPSSFPYVRALFYGSEPWSYFPVIPWLAYPFLGFAAGMLPVQLREKLTSRRVQLFVLAAWIVFLIFFLPFGIEIAALLPQYYHHGILYFAWVVLFLAGYVLLVLFLERVVPANDVFTYLQWLGRNVTVAYVAQWLIIGNLATILYRSQHPLRVALWFIAIMSAVSALIYSWNFLVAKFSISEGRKNL